MDFSFGGQGACSRHNHSVSFVALISDSYPQAFDLLVSTLQGELSTPNPPLDVVGGQSLCLFFLPRIF